MSFKKLTSRKEGLVWTENIKFIWMLPVKQSFWIMQWFNFSKGFLLFFFVIIFKSAAKIIHQKDTTRPKLWKNAKNLHFFSFSFILPPHFPSSTMYQFHPKNLHFWYMLPPLSLCLFYSTHTPTTKKRHNPFRLCHISVLLFSFVLYQPITTAVPEMEIIIMPLAWPIVS